MYILCSSLQPPHLDSVPAIITTLEFANMTHPHIHPFYRFWFTIVDPIFLLLTVLKCIFAPAAVLEILGPPSIEPYSPLSHGPLLHQAAALYGFAGIIYAVLLRASPDPKVWRMVQAATLGLDCALLAIFFNVFRLQGRLDVGTWHGRDWFNIGFTVWVGIIRAAYLMGVGGRMGKERIG